MYILIIREKPLAIYVFSNHKSIVDQFRNSTTSGGFCSNDSVMHVAGIIA